ncbi:unnamed protein product [Nesidiocoris tenuis]|uniref:Uncharacterized protein n=1 Tax=Nesidiocoris tenuis TaxID=355587 RepID=A0A6H5GZ53_9HEMI|nr:unnamed protein product [Nesidiocoris tenuis]
MPKIGGRRSSSIVILKRQYRGFEQPNDEFSRTEKPKFQLSMFISSRAPIGPKLLPRNGQSAQTTSSSLDNTPKTSPLPNWIKLVAITNTPNKPFRVTVRSRRRTHTKEKPAGSHEDSRRMTGYFRLKRGKVFIDDFQEPPRKCMSLRRNCTKRLWGRINETASTLPPPAATRYPHKVHCSSRSSYNAKELARNAFYCREKKRLSTEDNTSLEHPNLRTSLIFVSSTPCIKSLNFWETNRFSRLIIEENERRNSAAFRFPLTGMWRTLVSSLSRKISSSNRCVTLRFVYVPPGGATGKPLFAAVNRLERPKSTKALERLIKTMRHRRIEPHPRPTHNTRPKTHVNELTYLTSFQFDCCMFDHEIENEFDYELACEFDFEFEYEFEGTSPRKQSDADEPSGVRLQKNYRETFGKQMRNRRFSDTGSTEIGIRRKLIPTHDWTYSPKIESVVQHEIGQWEGTKYCETKGFRKSQCRIARIIRHIEKPHKAAITTATAALVVALRTTTRTHPR